MAAFFSFGECKACFFVSLFDFWDLDMRSTPVKLAKSRFEYRREAAEIQEFLYFTNRQPPSLISTITRAR